MPPSKEEKAAQAAERKAAAQAEAQRRRAEAESRKRREEEESAFANANGMGSYEHQGNRGSQEDRAATVRMPQAEFMRLVAVYDGHVGSNCAEFAKSQMPHLLQQTPEFKSGDFSAALPKALEAAHTQWLRSRAPSDESGSLATLALLHEGTLYVSCLGNGICVVCGPGGQARALTRDFRPEIPHKGLFGSEQPSPEKKVHALGPSDTFVILASDGVWDVIKPAKAAEIVEGALAASPSQPSLAAKALCDAAFNAESVDNICAAVLVCDWPNHPPPPQPSTPPQASAPPQAAPGARPAVAAARPAAVGARPIAAARPSSGTATATATAAARPTAAAAVARPTATAAVAAKPTATAAVAAKPTATATAAVAAKPTATAAVAAKPTATAAKPTATAAVAAKPTATAAVAAKPTATAAVAAKPVVATAAVKPATVKAAAPKKRGTGQKFQVEVPPGATPGQPFVALYYGIEYEVDVPVGMAAGASIKVEIEDYRGVRPRRAFVKVPDGCYEGDAFIITIDPSNDDGSLEDFEVDVPAGSGPGAYILASVPPK